MNSQGMVDIPQGEPPVNVICQLLAGLLAACSISASASVIALGQGTWETTLSGRDIDGHAVAADSADAVFLYDSALNLTWLRDTAAYGPMGWDDAMAFAAGLTINGFGGWRLPTLIEPGGCDGRLLDGCIISGTTMSSGTVFSELMYLWNVELGNAPGLDYASVNVGTFQNLGVADSPSRWIGVRAFDQPGPDPAWTLYMRTGTHIPDPHVLDDWDFMLVREGDIGLVVPEPGSLGLVLLALVLGAQRLQSGSSRTPRRAIS
jgi:hypothetical protein